MITNFSLSILRGVGDSRRPLYFLIQGSAVNLCLNIVFVKYLKLDVGGVAFATVLSQLLTTTMCVTALFRERSDARLLPKNIRFYRAELKRILWIGIPSGLQFACYALANTIIQSAINTLGSTAIAGNTAAMIVEMALHTWTGAIFQTIMTAVGQNYGAGEYRRVVRCILLCLMIVTTSITVLGHLTVRNGEVLLGLINDDPGVIACGMTRVRINLSAYALIATMDALSGALRGLGRSITPTVAIVVSSRA